MSYIKKVVGNNIKKYAKINNLTLEKLAEKIGINYRNLSKIQTGQNFLKDETLEKLCDALNVSPSALFSLEDALPETINDNDDIKPLLRQIIADLNEKETKALYKLILAFLEAVR